MNPFLVNILLHALGSAPSIIEDMGSAFKMNWDVPHVQQARQGVDVLGKLLADLAAPKVEQSTGAVVDPVQVSADPQPVKLPDPSV